MYLFDELFRGILVFLFTLENNQKANSKYTFSFIDSLVVFENSYMHVPDAFFRGTLVV